MLGTLAAGSTAPAVGLIARSGLSTAIGADILIASAVLAWYTGSAARRPSPSSRSDAAACRASSPGPRTSGCSPRRSRVRTAGTQPWLHGSVDRHELARLVGTR